MLCCLKPIILIGIHHIKADKLCQYARLEKGVTIDFFKVCLAISAARNVN
jgi:hypothetical protein